MVLKTSAILLVVIVCLAFPAFSQDSPLLSYKTSARRSRTVDNEVQWQNKRRQILENLQKAMGPLPYRRGLPDPKIAVGDTLRTTTYLRISIRLTVAEQEIVPAYLYLPSGVSSETRNPAMLVLHGTGAAGKKLVDGESPLANRALARELASRGYIVIAPDYPGMGESINYDFKNDRYESGSMKAVFNNMRCVDFLQSLPYVDKERIGVIGHSLGGHNAMFTAAFDTRLKVTVASCGWTLFDNYNIGEEGSKKYGGRLGPWAQEVYMPLLRDRYELDAGKIPFDFDEVIASLAPRAFFSNSPMNDGNFDVAGVKAGLVAAGSVYRLHGAEHKLKVEYPDAGHDFPLQTRLAAYEFIDRQLNHSPREHHLD